MDVSVIPEGTFRIHLFTAQVTHVALSAVFVFAPHVMLQILGLQERFVANVTFYVCIGAVVVSMSSHVP